MISILPRTSDAVDSISVSPLRGIVRATFSSGTYEYTGISRRAILNLIAIGGKTKLQLARLFL